MANNLCCATLLNTVVSEICSSGTLTCSMDVVLAAASQDAVDSNRSSFISTCTLFGSSCSTGIPNGHVVFLCDALVPVVSLNGCWIGFDGRNFTPTVGGALWSWGGNNNGRLGDNTITNRSSPVREITSSTTWCQTSAGFYHTSALKTDGTLWSWGRGSYGRLGDNTVTNRSSPVREITSSTTWCQTTSDNRSTHAIKTDGSLWSWGSNIVGQLGDNTTANRSSPVREITSSTTWCQTASSNYTASAVKTDGTLWSWGSGGYGRLGDNTATSKSSPVREITSSTTWCQTSAGGISTSAIKKDGTLWSWGGGLQLGDNTTTNRSSPVREASSSTTWCQTSVGYRHASAIKTDGALWSWGSNGCGQLGDNTTTGRSSPVREITSSTTWCQTSAGCSHNSALKTDGTLWTWGDNGCGQLGNNAVTNRSSPVREITSSTTWCQTEAGKVDTSAIKTILVVPQ